MKRAAVAVSLAVGMLLPVTTAFVPPAGAEVVTFTAQVLPENEVPPVGNDSTR